MHRPLILIGFAALVGYSVYKREQHERGAVVAAFNDAAGDSPLAKASALEADMNLRALVHQDVFFAVALSLAAGGLFLAVA